MTGPDAQDAQPADVAVVGAGPAGLSAATSAASAGLRVVLIDAGAQFGGQFWRHADESTTADTGAGHHDWSTFTRLRERLRRLIAAGHIGYLPLRQVWLIDRASQERVHRFTLALSPSYAQATEDGTRTVDARTIILCPGASDRQLPVPGWTLPGVLAAGGVQALLKGHATSPGRRVVVAGTGPFLLPVATGLAKAGAEVLAICEANSPASWLSHPRAAMRAPSKVAEGAGYAAALLRHRIPYRVRTAVTRIEGTSSVTGVRTQRLDRSGRVVPGTENHLEVDLVAKKTNSIYSVRW